MGRWGIIQNYTFRSCFQFHKYFCIALRDTAADYYVLVISCLAAVVKDT